MPAVQNYHTFYQIHYLSSGCKVTERTKFNDGQTDKQTTQA